MYEFIDISEFQRDVDFRMVKHDGIHAVMIRATYGVKSIDRLLNTHVHGARAAGLPIAFYHYAYPNLHHADVEARHFCEVVQIYGRDVPVALDMEEGRGRPTYEAWSRAFNHVVHARLGHFPYFYSNPSFIGDMKIDRPIGKGLWLSAYGPNDGHHHDVSVPHPWKHIAAHQYTSMGVVRGVHGNVDRNVAYSDIFSTGR